MKFVIKLIFSTLMVFSFIGATEPAFSTQIRSPNYNNNTSLKYHGLC